MRICLISLATILVVPHLHAHTLSDIRIGLHDHLTRIVLESDRSFPYRIFQLQDPARLIVDLPKMIWREHSLPGISRSPLIENFRSGLFRPHILRFVFDLKEPVFIDRHVMFQNNAQKWILMLEFHRFDAAENPQEISKDIKGNQWQEWESSILGATAQTFANGEVLRAPRRNESPTALRSAQNVVIDPGHGGPDPGAVAKGNVFEKNIVLKVAKNLKQSLEKLGITAHLTRDADYYIPLGKRYRIAEQKQATLFISLHADSAENPRANGASIYTLSDKASDKEAEKLAKKENASDILVGISNFGDFDPNVQQVLLSMSQQATQRESTIIAKGLLNTLSNVTKLKSHAHRSAGFAVLKSPQVPSVLVELGYLSHTKDRALLRNTQHQHQLADALAAGIAEYLKLLQ